MFLGASREIFEKATELRNKQTGAENILWDYLRLKPSGFKFRRQHPIKVYIVDFYCHALKLVIEVDGGIHRDREVRENDIDRQRHLEFEGMTFLRFTNEEIENNVEQVKMKIEKYCNDRKSHPLGLGLNQRDNK